MQHDIEGLATLHGGPEELEKKLDEFFVTPPEFLVGGYGFEIHEMSELAAGKWGQSAISNQPSFHIPFLYPVCPGKVEHTLTKPLVGNIRIQGKSLTLPDGANRITHKDLMDLLK